MDEGAPQHDMIVLSRVWKIGTRNNTKGDERHEKIR
jgi:hypothetical protein